MHRLVTRGVCQWVFVVTLFGATAPNRSLTADTVTTKSNMQHEGQLGKITEIGENPLNPGATAGPVRVTKIMLIDDQLRRVFISTNQVAAIVPGAPVGVERIKIKQRVAEVGRRIAGVGPIIQITPFDEFGRRIFSMNSPRGRIDVVQGITEVTPTYCTVEGLLGENSYVWDMRIRTSSIPRETLSKILYRHIDAENPDDRLRLVHLYIQAERFQDAGEELAQIIEEFPELRDKEKQVQALRQYGARRLIDEIQHRREAGQHLLAINMLQNFPAAGVAAETLIEVRDLLGEYVRIQQQGKTVLDLFAKHMAELKDQALIERLKPVQEELNVELNINTLARMAHYLRLADDAKLSVEQKLALAVSGWILGGDSGVENFAVALDIVEVRNLVREYLRSMHAHERDEILAKLEMLEGSSPSYLAKIVAHMKPAMDPPQANDNAVGLFELSVPGLTGEPDITYHIQLPPQYDPYRRYPCIVTLNGAGTTPLQQIDWWAGAYSDNVKMRSGQATRQGYIVIAPVWSVEHQTSYTFSATEHSAVLYSLRDACRRFAINTDRVYLTGHSMGGDAAWDIGLAHPDLWAGVLPVVATADKYIERYWENARLNTDHRENLPLYFVCGQLDGDRMQTNKAQFNRYLENVGFDATIVEYRGRGHEHFHDEIQTMFDWMEKYQRNFFPSSFTCYSLRPWDNFFFWAELDGYPERSTLMPKRWPESRKIPAETTGSVLATNGVHLKYSSSRATVWLAPEFVNFDERITINNKTRQIAPSVETLLEDVRTRGDRQHPFWAKVEVD